VRAAADRLLAAAGAHVSHHTLRTAQGGTVHHIESGRGDPVVLVHGGGGGCANWFRVIGALSRRFRVLAPDLPGFGESTPARASGPLGSQAAGFIADWLERVDAGAVHLVGTSFGAMAALRLAQTEPHRVRRLALVDAVGLGAAVPALVRLAALPGPGRVLLRPSRRGGALLFDTLLTGGRVPLPDALREPLLEYLWTCDVAGVARQLAHALPRFAGLMGQRERVTVEELRTLRVPTLIVWGGRDRFVPVRHARRAAALIPGARLVVLPAAGHSPNWETPDELVAALEAFLAGPPPRPA
jgi:pimeloyl-ACP methyl ester carboxylesterase